MSVERIALNAALDYGCGADKEIGRLVQMNKALVNENRHLRLQLQEVREAAARSRDAGQTMNECEAEMPKQRRPSMDDYRDVADLPKSA